MDGKPLSPSLASLNLSGSVCMDLGLRMENQGPGFAFDLADEWLTYSRPPRGCSCEESPRALIRVKLRPGERPEAPPQHHLHLQFLWAASWTDGSPTLHSPGHLPSQTADNCLKAPLPLSLPAQNLPGPEALHMWPSSCCSRPWALSRAVRAHQLLSFREQE